MQMNFRFIKYKDAAIFYFTRFQKAFYDQEWLHPGRNVKHSQRCIQLFFLKPPITFNKFEFPADNISNT